MADFSLCLICQKEKSEQLVHSPSSHEKLLKFVEEWAKYGDLRCFDLWSKLKSVSINELTERKASWHRSCYQEIVHTGLLKRAKERYVYCSCQTMFTINNVETVETKLNLP